MQQRANSIHQAMLQTFCSFFGDNFDICAFLLWQSVWATWTFSRFQVLIQHNSLFLCLILVSLIISSSRVTFKSFHLLFLISRTAPKIAKPAIFEHYKTLERLPTYFIYLTTAHNQISILSIVIAQITFFSFFIPLFHFLLSEIRWSPSREDQSSLPNGSVCSK